MPVELTSPKNAAPQKEWQITGRFVLVALVVFFAIVAGVNAVMMTMAIRTFSGVEARNGYDLSQAYNKEIARAREQAGRHWQSDIVILRDGGPVQIGLTLKDAAGAPVSGLVLQAQFRHPTDRRLDHTVALTESAAGTYSARPDAVASGVWSVAFTGTRDGERIYSADTRVTLN